MDEPFFAHPSLLGLEYLSCTALEPSKDYGRTSPILRYSIQSPFRVPNHFSATRPAHASNKHRKEFYPGLSNYLFARTQAESELAKRLRTTRGRWRANERSTVVHTSRSVLKLPTFCSKGTYWSDATFPHRPDIKNRQLQFEASLRPFYLNNENPDQIICERKRKRFFKNPSFSTKACHFQTTSS